MEKVENEIATLILNKAFLIHRELGPGLLESIYERVLIHELKKSGLKVASQVFIPFKWDNITFENGYRADLIVEEKVIVEIKSVQVLAPVHAKQLMTYLRLTKLKLGLLLNFNEALMKDGIKRVVNNL
ncbi:GxxExxY protein [Algoriphagus halophytocola]|uniref:GxxExxY protein n=1 Tax=Algoriphagus halophytocola TaxID=2991499 RepID=A0ABY6MEM8_9BACT|nr:MULTISPECIES: GxxExxY protein [unclassified Algoriphagus]UZD22257.1 GxxExxY protein [Algoriphagus sp. TR-M5]WBL43505.1 GxxExxY protein [Algoriphagus sp. TR-M9]